MISKAEVYDQYDRIKNQSRRLRRMQPFAKIVLAIPHATREFAVHLWDDPVRVSKDADHWTDWFTDALFDWQHPKVASVIGRVSRFDCDLERLEQDPLEAVGRGRIYTRSHSGAERQLSAEQVQAALRHWTEYRQQLIGQLQPGSVLIDCHSFPSEVGEVDVCIGVNEDWSRPEPDRVDWVIDHFRGYGYSTALNAPFSNSIRPETGFPYASLMIEINKKVYMDETCLRLHAGEAKIRRCLLDLYRAML